MNSIPIPMNLLRALARVVPCLWPRGISRGRFFTRDAAHSPLAKAKLPFVVDMPAPMLKRHAKISKGARMLYCTMRALANGRTGELSIRGGPLDWELIRRRAEICKNVWQRLLRELTAAGLVSCTRERVFVFKNGRKFAVLGRAHYFVYKQPKTKKKPVNLLKPFSCTVQEKGTQILSKPTLQRFFCCF